VDPTDVLQYSNSAGGILLAMNRFFVIHQLWTFPYNRAIQASPGRQHGSCWLSSKRKRKRSASDVFKVKGDIGSCEPRSRRVKASVVVFVGTCLWAPL